MRFPVVLFDLDGTLIDSGPMIVASMKHAARSVLGRDIPEEVLTAAVGGPGLVAQMRALAPEHVDDLVAAYREHNEPLHADLEAFWEVVDVLPRLRGEGRRLGIVTAKRRETVKLAFDRLPGLEDNFAVVITSDDTERHKPSPDPILAAIDRLDATPAETAYVGDSPYDIRAAKAAGAFAVAVAWGGIHADAVLEREQPDAFVRRAEELLGVL